MVFEQIFLLMSLLSFHFSTSYILPLWGTGRASHKPTDIIVGRNTMLYKVNAIYGNTEISVELNKFRTTYPYVYYEIEKMHRDKNILFPKILIITDDGLHQQFDTQGLIDFVVEFTRDINEYFRRVEDPKIVFSLAGLVMSTHPNAIPFIEPSYIFENGSDSGLNAEEILMQMKEWLSMNSDIISNYDFFIILSSWSLYSEDDQGKKYQVLSASTGKACENSTPGSVGLVVKLRSTFDKVSAAHEIGHLMGAQHDLESNRCSYIMCGTRTAHNIANFWSDFSLSSFSDAFSRKSLTCLQNESRR